MTIVVNHLTRMQAGYCCVAGLDVETNRHVRPVLKGQRLPTALLKRNGGPFDIGVMVDLGSVTPNAARPEVEDYVFNPATARVVKSETAQTFWDRLQRSTRPNLREIFGHKLNMRGPRSCGVDPGQGIASLGCLAVSRPSTLSIRQRAERRDQVRMRVSDEEFALDLSVTDIRLYGRDHVTPDAQAVQRTAEALERGDRAILAVGLTRPFPTSDYPPVHWLQVNNIHLEERRLWQLG